MKIRRSDSLSFRLTLWYTLFMGVLIVFAGFFLFHRLKSGILQEVDESLRTMAADLSDYWGESEGVTWPMAIHEAEKKYKDLHPYVVVVKFGHRNQPFPAAVFNSGNVLGDSFLLKKEMYEKPEESIDVSIYHTLLTKNDRYPVRFILIPVHGPYVLQMGISLKNVHLQLRRLWMLLVLAGLGLLLFTSFGGNLIIRQALFPVKKVVHAAHQITADDLSLRIDPGRRKDEIGALVETFNEMIARLETSVDRIKQFSGDVSHELRTPLTVIRGEIEVVLRKKRRIEEYVRSMQTIMEQTEQMGRIIQDLLFLSRIDAVKKSKRKKEIDFSGLASEVCESRKSQAIGKEIALSIHISSEITIEGDSVLLERMVANLIDNAIRYTPPGGNIDVTLVKNDGAALLSIRDTGIGIPQESLPFIFDRFYVVDPSRSKESGGIGLGLAIVKSVADLHGAVIEVRSQIDSGTLFLVRIPDNSDGLKTEKSLYW